MLHFKETTQELPNFQLPEIRRPPLDREMDSSMGFTDLRNIKMSGAKLKISQPLRKNYAGKRSLIKKNKRTTKHNIMQRAIDENFIPDPPPISDEDINRGMINLINKGIIPKDVDITPAFERGAPPLSLRPAAIHYGDPKDFGKREVSTGAAYFKSIKYDLQPEEDNPLAILPPSTNELVPFGSTPMDSGRNAMSNNEVEALPYEGEQIESIHDTEFDENKRKQAEDARGYNQLMDEFSLHQFIIRKGKCLDETPEFLSFKRTYISKWGSISYIIHLLEKMLLSNEVPMAVVEGKKLVDLANEDLKKPQNEDLYD